jgi:hypothetical protein
MRVIEGEVINIHTNEVSEGEVINIHTMRRSDEDGRRKGGVWWREVVELTSLIINIRHNYMQ